MEALQNALHKHHTTQGAVAMEQQPMTLSAPYRCPYCGAPSFIHPFDAEPPADYCHESDHGSFDFSISTEG